MFTGSTLSRTNFDCKPQKYRIQPLASFVRSGICTFKLENEQLFENFNICFGLMTNSVPVIAHVYFKVKQVKMHVARMNTVAFVCAVIHTPELN